MVGRALPAAGGLENEAELGLHPLLADELREPGRAQGALDHEIVGIALRIDDALVTCHVRTDPGSAVLP